MLTFGMGLAFAAYTVGSYGWVLLKGWDIPFRAWVSPLNPYEWPDGDPPTIPPSRLFPGSGSSASSGSSDAAPGAATQPAAGASGEPGTVPIRTQ